LHPGEERQDGQRCEKMKNVKNFINTLECPLIEGVIYSDGTLQLFDVEVSWARPSQYKLKPSYVTSIDELERKGELWWSSCIIMGQYFDEKESLRVICGGGNFGGDGFIRFLTLIRRMFFGLFFLLALIHLIVSQYQMDM
jgi:hypothetical protein